MKELESFEHLVTECQLEANRLGEAVYIIGGARGYRNSQLVPSSMFLPSELSILRVCWPKGWQYEPKK